MKLRDREFYSINENMKLIIHCEPSWIRKQELERQRKKTKILWRLGIIFGMCVIIWLQTR